MTVSQGRLKELLHYDPDTGDFTWLRGTNSVRVGDLAGWTKNPDGTGYRYIEVDKQRFAAHRLAFLYMTGELPEQIVDHIDGDPGNNAWDNLRDVSFAVNSRNRKKRRKPNASGHTGVYRSGDRWRAMIGVNRKKVSLGRFETIEEAVAARIAAEEKYGFTERHGA